MHHKNLSTLGSSSKVPRRVSLDDLYERPYTTVEEAVEKSEKHFAYVAGSDGIYKVMRVGGPDRAAEFHVVRPARYAPSLRKICPGFFIKHLHPIPMDTLARVIGIFRRAFEEHRSEMIVILKWDVDHYVLDRAKFGVIGPAYLEYYYKGRQSGTIHSHGSFAAGFSRTDDENEMESEGIYLVIGNLNHGIPSIVGSITGAGERQRIRVNDIPDSVANHRVTDEEYRWFMEGIMPLKEVKDKKSGFLLLNKRTDNVVYWTETEEEAIALAASEFDVRPIKKSHECIKTTETVEKVIPPPRPRLKPQTDGEHDGVLRTIATYFTEHGCYGRFAEILSTIAPLEHLEELMEAVNDQVNFMASDDCIGLDSRRSQWK